MSDTRGSAGLDLSLRRAFSLASVRWLALDWHVVAVAALLLGIGLSFLGAMRETDELFGRTGVNLSGHLQKLALSLPFFVVALALRPRWLRRNAYVVYGASIVLLLLVPIVGETRNGARRWIPLFGAFDLQPSELVKLGVIVALSRALYRNRLQRPRDFWPPLVLALVPMGLVALQPDLGTSLTIVPVTMGLLYLAGARAAVLVRFLLGAATVGFLVWKFQLGVHDYQMQRIDTWLAGFRAQDLIDAKSGPAFHSYHARVAVGNGGLFGTGLGNGVANQGGYLPERDCDSIFAVVAEETGWLGSLVVLGLYVLLIALLMGSASGVRDRFSRLVVGGIALYFSAHLFIHVGVNLGMIPMTGLTLPLFSTGGSSLLVTFLALGLALGLASHHEPSLDQDSFREY